MKYQKQLYRASLTQAKTQDGPVFFGCVIILFERTDNPYSNDYALIKMPEKMERQEVAACQRYALREGKRTIFFFFFFFFALCVYTTLAVSNYLPSRLTSSSYIYLLFLYENFIYSPVRQSLRLMLIVRYVSLLLEYIYLYIYSRSYAFESRLF